MRNPNFKGLLPRVERPRSPTGATLGAMRHPQDTTVLPPCDICGKVHPLAWEHKLPRSTCPRCQRAKRELVTVTAAITRMTYAPYCAACLVEEGFVQFVETHTLGATQNEPEREVTVTYWEYKLTPEEEARAAERVRAIAKANGAR